MTKDDVHPASSFLRKNAVIVLFAAVCAGLLFSTVYFYTQYKSASTSKPAQEDEVKVLTGKVGKLIVLPQGETPKVLTVTDKEKLSGQAFFANAKNGYKVLVYEKAKKAFLYDPGTNRVVEVGPVTFGDAAAASPTATIAPAAMATPDVSPFRVYLYNGTPTVGLTREYEITLKSSFPNAVIADRDNANKRDYAGSIVVDLTGAKSVQAASIAKALGFAVSALPQGETASSGAEFLIILGEDAM